MTSPKDLLGRIAPLSQILPQETELIIVPIAKHQRIRREFRVANVMCQAILWRRLDPARETDSTLLRDGRVSSIGETLCHAPSPPRDPRTRPVPPSVVHPLLAKFPPLLHNGLPLRIEPLLPELQLLLHCHRRESGFDKAPKAHCGRRSGADAAWKRATGSCATHPQRPRTASSATGDRTRPARKYHTFLSPSRRWTTRTMKRGSCGWMLIGEVVFCRVVVTNCATGHVDTEGIETRLLSPHKRPRPGNTRRCDS